MQRSTRRVAIVEPKKGAAAKRAARGGAVQPCQRRHAAPGAEAALRTDETLDSDDDLGSPLPSLPSFAAKVLRNNESTAEFLAWCAQDAVAEDSPADQPDTFAQWCASDSSQPCLKRPSLDALALAISEPQLHQLAVAHARAPSRARPTECSSNLPAAAAQPGSRARRKFTRSPFVRNLSASPSRPAAGGSPTTSSDSRTARRLDMSRAGKGVASEFASVGAPSKPCRSALLPIGLSKPCAAPAPPVRATDELDEDASLGCDEVLGEDEFCTAPPDADESAPPPAPRRSKRVPRLRA